ncbi:uncharacterized protein LOC143258436 [Tachypleus tridentatus]|uniref:uncharacterized protein LOC143258436 n=1 Tax=Tachypleus tridentatus TaxID=6853 RepID=UPI003FD0CB5A
MFGTINVVTGVIFYFLLKRGAGKIIRPFYFSDNNSLLIDDEVIQNYNYSEAFLGVTLEGDLVYQQMCNGSEPTTPYVNSVSVTSHLIGLAILKLVETQQINMNDRVFGPRGIINSFLHWKRFRCQVNDSRLYEIRIRHLLDQTSGLECLRNSRSRINIVTRQLSENFQTSETLIQTFFTNFLHSLLREPLPHPPGFQQCPGFEGFLILAYILQSLTLMPWKDYVNQYVLQPIGMWTSLKKESPCRPDEYVYSIQPTRHPNIKSFNDGYHDVSRKQYIDSILSWKFSATDLLRLFSTYCSPHSTLSISNATISAMLSTPPSGCPQLVTKWLALGFHVNSHEKLWTESNRRASSNDFVIACDNVLRNNRYKVQSKDKTGKKRCCCWVVVFGEKKNHGLTYEFKHVFESIRMPAEPFIVYPDVADLLIKTKDKSQKVIIKFRVHASDVVTYLRNVDQSQLTVTFVSYFVYKKCNFTSFVLYQDNTLSQKGPEPFSINLETFVRSFQNGSCLTITDIIQKNELTTGTSSCSAARSSCDPEVVNISQRELGHTIASYTNKGYFLKKLYCWSQNSDWGKMKLVAVFTRAETPKWILQDNLSTNDVRRLSEQFAINGFIVRELCAHVVSDKLVFLTRWIKEK